MSLTDAMLLEGYRDPKEVYIALRTDGLKGSGTIDDPYDGGTVLEEPLASTLTCDRFEFVIGVAFPHGITAVSTPSAPVLVVVNNASGAAASWFNGTFEVVEVASPLHLVVRFSAAKTGTPPVNLPPAPASVPYSYLDTVLYTGIQVTLSAGATIPLDRTASLYWPVARVTTNVTPHGIPTFGAVDISIESPNDGFAGRYATLGPGTVAPDTGGRSFRYRLSFLPSANISTPVSCTIEKVVYRFDELMRASLTNSIIHLGRGTFETRGYCSRYVSHPSLFDQLHVGWIIKSGQCLHGSGLGATTVKLVLPIDDYNQTIAIANPSSPKADYAVVSDLTVNCNTCGHIAPHGIFPAPVTCCAVSIGGSFVRVSRVRAIEFCCQGRAECFPLFATRGNGETPVFNLLENCIMEKPGENNTHETSLMNNGSGETFADARSPVVRHNFADCTYVREDGSRHTSRYVAVESITQHASPDFDLFTLVTKEPHQRTAAHNVQFHGITFPSGFETFRANDMPVVAVDSDTVLTFRVRGLDATMTFQINSNGAFVGSDFHATQAFSGSGCVTEGNAIFDVPEAFYIDSNSTQDGVIRYNYYSNIHRGQYYNFPDGFTDSQNAKTLTRSVVAGKFIATFLVADGTANLKVRVGDLVDVSGARIGGVAVPKSAKTFVGAVNVLAVATDKRSFTYEMLNDPITHADPPSIEEPIRFRGYRQTRRLVVENNVYDLNQFDINEGNVNTVPRGMTSVAFAGPALPDYPRNIFPDNVIRDNIFRHVEGVPPVVDATGNTLYAVRVVSYDRTLFDGNIIDIPTPHPVHHLHSGRWTAFGNLTPQGELVRVHEDTGGTFVPQDSLETRIGDALLCALL